MRSTVRQVAQHAQVSRMTVSNVVLGRHKETSPQTRERVLESIRILGYVPVNPPSRQSTHIPTRIIGLFYEAIKLDEYWGFQTSRGLHEGAVEHNYDLLTMLRTRSGEAIDKEELRFLDRRSDGFIFLAPAGRAEVLRTLVEHEIPVVTAFTDQDIPGVSSVTLDNKNAMKLAVNCALEAGHRNLAFLSEPHQRSDFLARRTGFDNAVKDAGCRAVSFDFQAASPDWADEVLELIKQRKVTAVICASDYAALELIRLAAKHKLLSPRDFSIIGMDDIPDAASKNLTTLKYSPGEIGRRAVESINYRLAGDEAQQCNFVVPVELENRKTVGPVTNS